MAGPIAFEVQARRGHARRGRLRTPHGWVDTPAFMPVGTAASVKGLTPEQIASTGTQILLSNTYHLMLRPGADVVERLGGLHRFMDWPGAILTDSGGYQVFSLADLRRIDDDGITFRSHLDGAEVRLDPESAVRIQNQLGADVAMLLDECPALPAARDVLEAAVRRTVAWAARCKAAHARPNQGQYAIVQGGLDTDMRLRCLDALVEIGFDGYALGGLSVGEKNDEMRAVLDAVAHRFPEDRPRYLMGVGTPLDIAHAVAAGIDQFDCVLPTRNGRKGYAYTWEGVVRLRNAAHRLSEAPLDAACDCYCCRRFTRAYLRHLIVAGELLGGALVSLHNVRFYQSFMARMRGEIEAGSFDAWRRAFVGRWKSRPAEPGETDPETIEESE
jgi:queuine tRNA-ribosyltransferase